MTPSPFLSAVHAGSVSECVKVVVSVWSCGESSGRLDCASSFGFSFLYTVLTGKMGLWLIAWLSCRFSLNESLEREVTDLFKHIRLPHASPSFHVPVSQSSFPV